MKGFHRVSSSLCSRRDLSANAKLGFAYLGSRLRMGLAWPTLTELCADLGVARATAVRLLRELESAGMVTRDGTSFDLCESGSEPEPPSGLDSEPVSGSEPEPSSVQKLDSVGSEPEPIAVQNLNSAPSYTENSDHSESVQRARAHEATGLLLFEQAVRDATGVGPDIGGLREWWRRTSDEWVSKANRPPPELDAEIRAFGAWLSKQPERKRSRVVPHLRFRDHLGQWSRLAHGSSSVARNARSHEEFVGDDVDAVFAEVG